jgi:hypothetical protein
VHRTQVGEHVLGPVAQHQGDEVAALHAERGQAHGQLGHALAVLLPGQVLPGAVLLPRQRGPVTALLRVAQQHVTEGLFLDLGVQRGALGGRVPCLHGPASRGGRVEAVGVSWAIRPDSPV